VNGPKKGHTFNNSARVGEEKKGRRVLRQVPPESRNLNLGQFVYRLINVKGKGKLSREKEKEKNCCKSGGHQEKRKEVRLDNALVSGKNTRGEAKVGETRFPFSIARKDSGTV